MLGLATLLSELLRRSSEMLRTNGRLLHKVRGKLSTLVLRRVKFSDGKRIPFRTKTNIIYIQLLLLLFFFLFILFKCYVYVLLDRNNTLVNDEFVMFNSDAFNLLYTSSKTIMIQINAFTCFLQLISVTQLIIDNNNN